ncbi:Hypothetical predicted protein, partial [Paramuricea clavata]
MFRRSSSRASSIDTMQDLKRQGGWLCIDSKPVLNCYLKIVGRCAVADADGERRWTGEGRWIVEAEGDVLGEWKRRWILLKAGDFDTSASLLHAVRSKFRDGAMYLDPVATSQDVNCLRQCLVKEYRQVYPGSRRIGYIAEHLGYQNIPNSNYWYLGEELHIENNAALPEEAFRVFQGENDLQAFSTTMNQELLDPLIMKDAMTRLFPNGLIYLNVLLPGESNIAMLYSEARNCGKSLSLQLFAYLQGATVPHPIIFAGGNETTLRQSMIRAVSSTTLVSLFDDPKMTASFSEYLYQLQGGLTQGSLKSGVHTPKGTIMFTGTTKESDRLEGRILRFDFTRDPNRSSENESRLVDFVKDNKGLIVAWGMRMKAIWPEVARHAVAIQRILKNIDATADLSPRIADVIHSLGGNRSSTALVLKRLQRSILVRIREEDVAPLTWINPSVRVTPSSEDEWVPGFAIRKTAFENLDVSWSEVHCALGETANIQRSIAFAKDRSATLADLRRKTTKCITTAQGIKIPRAALDQLFLDWIDYEIDDDGEEPEDRYNPVQGSNVSREDLGCLRHVEKEVVALVADRFSRRPVDPTPPRPVLPDFEIATAPLTPRSKRLLETRTASPGKRRVLLLGFQLGQSYLDPGLRTPSGRVS